MTTAWVGFLCLAIFIFSYSLVIAEEHIHLRKSKPVIVAGCLMWMFIGIYEHGHSGGHAHEYIVELIAEIGELFFFLLAAMTYINTLAERNVFNTLRTWLLSRGWDSKTVLGNRNNRLLPFSASRQLDHSTFTCNRCLGGKWR